MENFTNQFPQISGEYAIAYYEICEILKRIDIKDLNKIPKELIEKFEKQKSKNCKFRYNDNLKLKEQDLSKKTKQILAVLYIDYLATEDEKEVIKRKQKEFQILKEKKLNEKFDYSKIFAPKDNKDIIIDKQKSSIEDKKHLYLRLLEKIKNIFKLK
ncbi:MAG: hypothetical protein IKM97_01440 [Clostridia bacterium]|nr:hypothetical protein [Clostridia bacterium]